MTLARLTIVVLMALTLGGSQAQAQRQMEALGRGTVALRRPDGQVFVAWRLLATDPAGVRFRLTRLTAGRDPVELMPDSSEATNFLDPGADRDRAASYVVQPVDQTGRTLEAGRPAQVRANDSLPYHEVPVQPLLGYTPNDASVGDLDGDGEYELVVHMTGRGRDNSQNGLTDPPILDAYRLDGSRLWSINLGRNIREGAHYTQFLVYDFDGDGRSEAGVQDGRRLDRRARSGDRRRSVPITSI